MLCVSYIDNGDGTVLSLASKKAKCSILFAVYVTRDRKSVYGMNFGKKGMITLLFRFVL